MQPAYNRDTGECDQVIQGTILRDSIVLVEGGNLLNKGRHQLFDIAVRLDVSNVEKTLERLRHREGQKDRNGLEHSFVSDRYFLLDLPFDNYLRKQDSAYFDVLVDTTDMHDIKLFRRATK